MKKQKQFSLQLEDLELQQQALSEARCRAESAEEGLRQELEGLRGQGDQQDRQRMVRGVYVARGRAGESGGWTRGGMWRCGE